MKSRVHAVTPSNQGAIGGVGSKVHGEQELIIGTGTSALRVADSAWFSNLLVGRPRLNLNWIQGPKRMYCHSVFTRNSETSHRCQRLASFSHCTEISR